VKQNAMHKNDNNMLVTLLFSLMFAPIMRVGWDVKEPLRRATRIYIYIHIYMHACSDLDINRMNDRKTTSYEQIQSLVIWADSHNYQHPS
jgi:hypothetical protein